MDSPETCCSVCRLPASFFFMSSGFKNEPREVLPKSSPPVSAADISPDFKYSSNSFKIRNSSGFHVAVQSPNNGWTCFNKAFLIRASCIGFFIRLVTWRSIPPETHPEHDVNTVSTFILCECVSCF